MKDLTKITEAFCFLDAETQAAMKSHGGPYELLDGYGAWMDASDPAWVPGYTYRVKPQPPKPREWWINPDGRSILEIIDGADVGEIPPTWVRVCEVL